MDFTRNPWPSQAYRDIIVLEPLRARSYYLMGIAAGSLGRQAEAEIYLRNALRINVHYVEALHNLGTPVATLNIIYYICIYGTPVAECQPWHRGTSYLFAEHDLFAEQDAAHQCPPLGGAAQARRVLLESVMISQG